MASKLDQRNQYLHDNYPILFVAINYHKNHKGKHLTFENHAYLKELYLDKSDHLVIMKSTQCGITEYLVILSIMSAKQGRSVFYVLPTYELKNRFVKNRIDKTIEYTKYYQALLQTREGFRKFSESSSLKHIGTGAIAFVGSNSPVAFIEYPADDLIVDELDQCHQGNLSMAVERLSASEHKKQFYISNPTYEDFGIDNEFKKSDMKKWFIKCGCGNWINPDFFSHVLRKVDESTYILLDKEWTRESGKDIRMVCDKCHKPFNRFSNGFWIKENNRSLISGYHISKLFSSNVTVLEIVDRFEEGLKNDSKLERFYNGDLGLPFTSSGSKITKSMLDECRDNYVMPDSSDGPSVMGIDVGSKLHVRISEIINNGSSRKLRAVYIGAVDTEEDVRDLYNLYNVRIGVIDSLPETRLSKKICLLRGMFRCFYSETLKKDSLDPKNKILTVRRTPHLDAVKEAIMDRTIILPGNAGTLKPLMPDGQSEYYSHMTASIRVFETEKQRYKWVEGSKADHFFHAEAYHLLALKILLKASQ